MGSHSSHPVLLLLSPSEGSLGEALNKRLAIALACALAGGGR